MKITYRLSDIHATGNTTISFGPTAEANPFKVTAEQLAATWNRPLADIRARLLRLGPDSTVAEVEQFGRWVMEKGMTPTAKLHFNGTG